MRPATIPVERKAPPQRSSPAPPRHAVKSRTGGMGAGATINHPKYGRGTVLRREGEGEDAKLTISFPGIGLKKIIEKYAGMKVEE